MGSSTFRAKHFKIEQDRCAMKVSTDSILIGSLADLNESSAILDIGCGTGILSLMCAQRCPEGKVVGIELDPEAASQAEQNVSSSSFADRIEIKKADVKTFKYGPFDTIICNPPFYVGDLLSPNLKRNAAKHASNLPLAEVLKHTARLLTATGRASFIFPMERKTEFLNEARLHGLFAIRITDISYQRDKPNVRFVVTLARKAVELCVQQLVVQEQDNSYTSEYRVLTKAFLTKKGSS